MSSTPKRFTRYDAEHHDPATEYVLASEHDAACAALVDDYNRLADQLPDGYQQRNTHLTCELDRTRVDKAQTHAIATGAPALSAADQLVAQARESLRLQRRADTLTRELEAAQAQLVALSYPVQVHTNPVLTVESGGIRYVLEVLDDEDGEWFEVKSATPTEAKTLADLFVAHYRNPVPLSAARQALAAYRAAQREDDEASPAY